MKPVKAIHPQTLSVFSLLGIAIFFLLFTLSFNRVSSYQALTKTPSAFIATIYAVPTSTPQNVEITTDINNLMRSDNCILPCWWGLKLGESSEAEVKELFNTYFIGEYETIEDEHYIRFAISPVTVPENELLDALRQEYGGSLFRMSLWVNREDSQFTAATLVIRYPAFHYVDWSAYLPSKLLAQYGTPDEVNIMFIKDANFSIEPRTSVLIFRYYSLGLYVEYEVFTVYGRNKATICNDPFDIRLVSMWIEEPGMLFPEILMLGGWDRIRYKQDYQTPIENVISITLEDLVEIFSQESMCVEATIE